MSGWTVVMLPEAAAEIAALPTSLRTRFQRIVDLVETLGLPRLREPYVKHLEGKLWEMRMIGQDGHARAVYVAANGRRAVVLHVFVKKEQRTPRNALDTARRRAARAGLAS